jgi:hypothetical protein
MQLAEAQGTSHADRVALQSDIEIFNLALHRHRAYCGSNTMPVGGLVTVSNTG